MKKENLKKQLYDMLIASKINLRANQDKYDKLVGNLTHMRKEMSDEQRLISTAQILGEQQSLDEIRILLEETMQRKEKLEE